MKKALLIPALLLPLTGCQLAGGLGQASLGETVATVNGQPIYKVELDNLLGDIQHRGMSGEVPRDRILQELINRELLRQEAEQKKLDARTDTAARLYSLRRAVLSQAAMQDFAETNPPTDEALKKEYDQRTQAQGTEYKARHILVKTEDEAKEIIGRLNKGEAFEKLAKAKSLDGSGKAGGSLDWFAPQQMVEPFAKAVVALENGKITETPVQTQYGWHVILREETRTRPAPPFETVKEQIRHMLQTQNMQKHVEDLTAKAKITKTEESKTTDQATTPTEPVKQPEAAAPANKN